MTDTGRIDALLTQGRFTEAYDLARELATAGLSSAQMTLGWMYQLGKGVERDFDQAKFWYRSALQSQSPRAEFYLGTVYWNESAFADAVSWFQRAASGGFTPAMYQLARMYRHGVGVPRDPTLAAKYVAEAARGGHIFARRDLARDMLKGRQGLSRVPLGVLRLIHVGWSALRTASRNIDDDLLSRL
jgi:TPR repeat protein